MRSFFTMAAPSSRPLLVAIWGILHFSALITAAKVWLCGDSTMARGNGKIEGWGEHLQPFMNIPVVNKAIGGRSARSFTVEGRFNEVAKQVQQGDFVVIEFGHNDGGSLKGKDNGRTDCPGSGKETCKSNYQGKSVTVQTFPTYMINAGKMFVGKGAHVVFSSMTPNNICEKGPCQYGSNRFVDYARDAAKAVGKSASFVDHGAAVGSAYKSLGAQRVNALYPQDHTHTNAAGAKIVAEAFAKAVVQAKDPLAPHVKGVKKP